MRLRLARRGYWIQDKKGRWRQHAWVTLIPLLALLPSIVVSFMVGLINTTSYSDLGPNDQKELALLTLKANTLFLVSQTQPPKESQLPTLQIYVDNRTFSEMSFWNEHGDESLGHSEGGDAPYFSARFRDESGVLQRAKVSLRGWGDYHHYMNKPSLRVRIKKSDVALDRRYVELTRPKDVIAARFQIHDMLSESLGIQTTKSDQVRVFINGKFFGVYLRSFRPGEEFAVSSKRMPGTYYKGDAIGAKQGQVLWENADIWSVFDIEDSKSKALLGRFLEVVNRDPKRCDANEIWNYLDFESYAKFCAVATLMGNTHSDTYHNHVLYYSTYSGKFEAIPWDPLSNFNSPVDFVSNPIMGLALRSPTWVHRRNELLWGLMHGSGSEASVREWLNAKYAMAWPDLKADINVGWLVEPYRIPMTPGDIDGYVDFSVDRHIARLKVIKAYFNDCKVWFIPQADQSRSQVIVSGRVAVKVSSKDGSKVELRDSEGTPVNLLYPGISEPYQHANAFPNPEPDAAPLVYSINQPLSNIEFTNYFTGEKVTFGYAAFVPASESVSLPAGRLTPPAPSIVNIGPGVVTVSEDIIVGEAQTLVIAPGTTLKMGPGSSVYSRGKTIVRGTKQSPIAIEPLSGSPWGCFAVAGSATSGSEFAYVSMSGGTLGFDRGRQFKGMFNVYQCPEVQISNCRFERNVESDDTVNLAESHVVITDSVWVGANSDALDLDMCTGMVERCRFIDSGNDGLDVSECRVRVKDCQFIRSGDKGISIGEGSRIYVTDSLIQGCLIGIEPKDASRAILARVTFDKNKTQIHAYQKKYFYGRGGSALLKDVSFVGDNFARLEARTSLTAINTDVQVSKDEAKRLITAPAIPADWAALIKEIEGR